MKTKATAAAFALLAAALYAINIPLSKQLLVHMGATMMAAFLYLGTGPGLLLLGFVAYGLSIRFYILAQKDIGAAKTSAFYSAAPFLGAGLSMLLGERPAGQFYLALTVMVVATVLMVRDTVAVQHDHEHSHAHCHAHRHGELVHTHTHTHQHSHPHTHHTRQDSHRHAHRGPEGYEHTHSD